MFLEGIYFVLRNKKRHSLKLLFSTHFTYFQTCVNRFYFKNKKWLGVVKTILILKSMHEHTWMCILHDCTASLCAGPLLYKFWNIQCMLHLVHINWYTDLWIFIVCFICTHISVYRFMNIHGLLHLVHIYQCIDLCVCMRCLSYTHPLITDLW